MKRLVQLLARAQTRFFDALIGLDTRTSVRPAVRVTRDTVEDDTEAKTASGAATG